MLFRTATNFFAFAERMSLDDVANQAPIGGLSRLRLCLDLRSKKPSENAVSRRRTASMISFYLRSISSCRHNAQSPSAPRAHDGKVAAIKSEDRPQIFTIRQVEKAHVSKPRLQGSIL